MKTLIKTLLILYNVVGTISANTTTFNPLNYEGNESKYDVIVPKKIGDTYDRPLLQAYNKYNTILYYTDNEGNLSTEKSNNNYPLLIQQYNNSSTPINHVYEFNNDGSPNITEAKNKDGDLFKQNGNQIFIVQFFNWIDNNKLNFDNDGNPIFLKDESKFFPSIKEDDDTYTEVNDIDYNIGELIEIETERDVNGKKIIKQKCITNNIQWYDFGTYYEWIKNGGYTTFPGQEHGFTTFTVKQDTNFIVKNNFELYEKGLFFSDYNVKLFIPSNNTLILEKTLTNSYSINGNNIDCLVFGTVINNNNAAPAFGGFKNNLYLILTPNGKIDISENANANFIDGGDQFTVPVIYPLFVLDDNHLTSNDNLITSINISRCYSFAQNGVVYLNRFTKDDTNIAKLLKGIIQYNMNIVFPNFMNPELPENKNKTFLNITTINNSDFTYTSFFSNLLWWANSGGKGQLKYDRIPMKKVESAIIQAKYFFEDVYRAKKRLWDVDFVPDSFNRNVLNNTIVQNPFLEYDEKYYKGEIVDTITEGESPSYSGETSYNPSGDNNKYWRTDTVEDLFSNGESYNDTGILKNLPTTLNVGLINENKENSAEERVTTSGLYSDSITLNGDNQYFNGIYTIPSNFKQINLNNKTALLKIEQVDESGNVIYKDNNQDNSVNLSNLKYNVMTNIDWDLNKTGKGVVSETTATLDMDISSSSNNDSVITFTNPINTNINKIEFTGDNTGYNGYITLPDNITEVIFNNGDKQNDIDKAVLKILSITAKAYITGIDTNNIIIKKFEEKFNMSNINKIIHSGTTYIKDASGIWKDTSENNMPDNLKNAIFETGISSSETFDKRDEINKLRSTTYERNNKDYYFNTATVNSINQIDTCFKGTSYTYDDSNASNNMPPIINNGLINDGNITIINSDINNTKVELNGKNNGHKSGNNIGKPYTGNIIISSNQNINTIQFGNYSFVPNIVNEQEDQYKTLMYFFEPNTINDVKKFDESTEPLSLTLKTMDIGHYASSNNTGKTVIDNTIIKAKTFKVRQGMNCTLQNGAHLTVKTNTNS